MSRVLISVAIAAYKVEKYIRKTLESVLAQDFEDYEVIVVDDCGGDGTNDVVSDVIANHPKGNKVRLVSHPHNIGTGGARNTGIDEAQGKYIFFLDGDDYIEPNTLSLLYNKIEETGDQLVISSHRVVDEDGRELNKRIYKPCHYEGKYCVADWLRETNNLYPVFLWNKLYNLQFVRDSKCRCIPSHRNEDPCFSYQLIYQVTKFSVIGDITLNYVMRPGSTIHQSLSDFYYNQYIEMAESMYAVIQRYSTDRQNIPGEFFDYVGARFLEGNTMRVLGSDYSSEKKKIYLEQIRKIKDLANVNSFASARYSILIASLKLTDNVLAYKLAHLSVRVLTKLKLIKKGL